MITSDEPKPNHLALFVMLLALIVWIPLPHGGEQLWEHSSFASASLFLLAIWCYRHWQSRVVMPAIITQLRMPLILLLCWLGYVFLQAVPLPKTVVNVLNPGVIAYHELLGENPSYSLSIDAGSTLIEAFKYSSYLAIFFLTLALCNTPKRLKILATTLFLTGATLALYSLANHFTAGAFSINEPIPPWGKKWAEITRGTFSHQNHFSAFLAMTIPLGIALLYSKTNVSSNANGLRHRLASTIDFLMSLNAVYVLFLIMMLGALLLTASRGGNTAFLLALLITSLLFLSTDKRKLNFKRLSILPISLLVLIAIYASTGAAEGLMKRLEDIGFSPNGRDHMHTTAYEITKEYPIVGSGAGTYPQIQHIYKSPELGISAMSKRAHNDYLETLTDQGIIGLLMLGASLSLLLFKVVRAIGKTKDNLSKHLLWSTTVGLCAILLHSLAEFNFQIPANAVYFFLLLAIGNIISFQNLQQTEEPFNP